MEKFGDDEEHSNFSPRLFFQKYCIAAIEALLKNLQKCRDADDVLTRLNTACSDKKLESLSGFLSECGQMLLFNVKTAMSSSIVELKDWLFLKKITL